jgi:hypothetical protein
MSLVNITDTAIEPKSLHFTAGGVFEPDPASDTLQTTDWSQITQITPLQDNQQVILPLGSNFNTGHAYHICCNLGLNAMPLGGYGATPDTFLNSWEIACKMGGNVIYSTISHWSSINSTQTMATTNVSLPISFIIVVDTTRTLDLFFTCNADYHTFSGGGISGSGEWSINADPAYVVTGKISYIDLGQVTVVQHGIPPTPPPQPIPPVFDPVPPLLITQGGIYTNLPGFVTPYVYPTI